MRQETCDSFPVSIFMAGDYKEARRICRGLCDKIGFCVTLTPTCYIYTDGEEAGFIVGLINYPRFPIDPETMLDRAVVFAEALRLGLKQQSYSIQGPNMTIWNSYRDEEPQP